MSGCGGFDGSQGGGGYGGSGDSCDGLVILVVVEEAACLLWREQTVKVVERVMESRAIPIERMAAVTTAKVAWAVTVGAISETMEATMILAMTTINLHNLDPRRE